MKIHSLFPTPVAVVDLKKYFDWQDLYQYCKNLKNDDMTKIMKHGLQTGDGVSTYTSPKRILEHEKFSLVRGKIDQQVKLFCIQTGIDNVVLGRSWFNIQSKLGTTMQHNHRMSVISGALYLYAENTTPITFRTPLNPYKMGEPVMGGHTQFDVESFDVPAETGMLVLFPSWLEHYVGAVTTDERCVLSFNYHTHPDWWEKRQGLTNQYHSDTDTLHGTLDAEA